MMTKPIARLVPDPTPLDSTSGIMPATKASVVIRMGRKRSRLACTTACVPIEPVLAQLDRVVDLQDRVLLHDAKQHEQAQRREDVQRLLREDDRQQRERQRERQREQDRHRVQPRLELRRQNQVHEDERQHEREHEVARGAARAPSIVPRSPPGRTGRAPASRTRAWNAAIGVVCDQPGIRLAKTDTWRWRPRRLISAGAVPASNCATFSRATAPSRDEGTVSLRWPPWSCGRAHRPAGAPRTARHPRCRW